MADFYTLLTNAGIAYETACKAAGTPIKLTKMSVGDGNGAIYNPDATAIALKREVWRGDLNALFQDKANPSWLLAEVTIPPEVGGWYVREAGIWTNTGILYAIVKYPESFKPVLATSGTGKEFYIRSIFETSNAALVTLLIDDTVVKATRSWVTSYVADELAKLDKKQSVRVATTGNIVLSGAQTIDGVAVVAGDRVLVKSQTLAKDNGIYVAANGAWARANDADASVEVTSGLNVSVDEGATLADTIWQLITDGALVLGTTALTFQNITQGFAPLNSPVLLGAPVAPTAPQFDNSLRIASTAFVQRALGNRGAIGGLNASVTLAAANTFGMSYMLNSETPFTVTLPLANTSPNGGVVTFTNVSTAPVTLALQAADYMTGIAGVGSGGRVVLGQRDTITLSCAGGTTWYAEDGSVRDAQSSAVRALMGNLNGWATLLDTTSLTAAHCGVQLIGSSDLGGKTVTLPPLSGIAVGSVIHFANGSSLAPVTIKGAGSELIGPGYAGSPAPINSFEIGPMDAVVLVCLGVSWRMVGGSQLNKHSAQFAASLATNGYERLPSGLIRQWCNGSIPAGVGTARITLPITFPNNLMSYSFGTSSPGTWVTGQTAGPTGIDIVARTVSAGAIALPSGIVGYTFECVGF